MGIPLTGLLAAIFILGEEPTTELFIGGGIILLGVVMIVFNKKKN
jgi:O-acetylserine/cysteine efflux transporter